MTQLIREITWADTQAGAESLLTREWLVTNGLGGYASGTILGVPTRRYHGLLIAALPAPFGRMMMLNRLNQQLRLADGTVVQLGGLEQSHDPLDLSGSKYLSEFRLESGLPVWRFQVSNITMERRIYLLYQQNTVHITYRLLSGEGPVRLILRPSVFFRPHGGRVDRPLTKPYALTIIGDQYEVSGTGSDMPPLRLKLYGERARLTVDDQVTKDIFYRSEASRGYDAEGPLWSPCYFSTDFFPGQGTTLVASTEPWNIILAVTPDEALSMEQERRNRLLASSHPKGRKGIPTELVLASDQFVITPAGRVEEAARSRASGDEVRTIIAGYHWFTDWGRDTMISLEGLTLLTGRREEARWILRTFAHYVHEGLIPNLFPEGRKQGRYHTADATLWFFHALERYLAETNDRDTLRITLPKLLDIIEHHLRGTLFGIRVDPKDGLLHQGQEGYQLTWMDAKVGDWVVTPRRGKAVEINALWYNALRLAEQWVQEEKGGEAARAIAEHADRARQSFNERFWYEEGGYLYDVIDGDQGDDAAFRPNQIFAISLRNPVLDPSKWKPVMEEVRRRLLTPLGLRSLAPGHPDYKPTYDGDLRARDAAYHQGTVWAWLIGPFIDAWLKVHPEDQVGARRFLDGFVPHLSDACIGSISEVFDAKEPFTPRGCVSQAWSVAEVFRSWIKTGEP